MEESSGSYSAPAAQASGAYYGAEAPSPSATTTTTTTTTPKPQPEMSVKEWLTSLGLERYAEAFEREDVTWDTLREMSESDFKDLGLTLGHRKKVLSDLRARFPSIMMSSSTPAPAAAAPTPASTTSSYTTTSATTTAEPSVTVILPVATTPTTEEDDVTTKLREKSESFAQNKCVISDVVLDKVLGEGSFGQVLRGTWQGNVIAAKRTKNFRSQEELLEEAETNMKVRHPNCVQFFGVFFADGFAHMVTEYMPLGSLHRLLQLNSFTPYELLCFCRDCAAGMMYLSSIKIVHRDLATRNLLVKQEANSKFVAKVADFGLSRSMTGPSDEYHSAGGIMPFRWTAPEGLRDQVFTTKSDVWSFGVTVWEIFSKGAQPFTGLTNSEVKAAVLAGQRLSAPPACPQRVWAAIRGCWHPVPQMRPTFEVVHAELVAILSTMRPTTATKLVTDDGARDLARSATCVQCGMQYNEDENADESCGFHCGWFEGNTYTCCNKTEGFPCSRAKHRSAPHCEYPYSAFFKWAHFQAQGIKQTWLSLRAIDYESRTHFSGEIGLLASGALFLSIYRGNTPQAWFSYMPEQLRQLEAPADGTKQIWTRAEDAGSLTAYFTFDGTHVSGIGLRMQTPSIRKPREKIVPLLLNETKIGTTGNIVVISEDEEAETTLAAPGEYTLPPIVETGPKLDLEHEPGPAVMHTSEGNPRLVVKQTEPTMVWMDLWVRDGKFNNHFRNKVSVVNLSKRRHVIMDIRAEYKRGDEWIPADSIIVFTDVDSAKEIMPVVLEPSMATSFYVLARIKITGQPGRDNFERNRAHASLPQPMQFRLTFETERKKCTTLVCEQVNRSIRHNITTQKEKEESLGVPILHWITCDDIHYGSQLYFFLNVTTSLVIGLGAAGRYVHLDDEEVRRAILLARKNREPAFNIEALEHNGTDSSMKVELIIDLDRCKAYAVRCRMKTTTSSMDAHLPLPDIAKLRAAVGITATPSIVEPAGTITVAWRSPIKNYYRVHMRQRYMGSYISYEETKDPAMSGSFKFEAPHEGEIVFDLSTRDSYNHATMATSSVITIAAAASAAASTSATASTADAATTPAVAPSPSAAVAMAVAASRQQQQQSTADQTDTYSSKF